MFGCCAWQNEKLLLKKLLDLPPSLWTAIPVLSFLLFLFFFFFLELIGKRFQSRRFLLLFLIVLKKQWQRQKKSDIKTYMAQLIYFGVLIFEYGAISWQQQNWTSRANISQEIYYGRDKADAGPLFRTICWLRVNTLLALHSINWPGAHLGSCRPIWGDLFSLEWTDKGTVKKSCHPWKNTLAFCPILLHFQWPVFSPLPWFSFSPRWPIGYWPVISCLPCFSSFLALAPLCSWTHYRAISPRRWSVHPEGAITVNKHYCRLSDNMLPRW